LARPRPASGRIPGNGRLIRRRWNEHPQHVCHDISGAPSEHNKSVTSAMIRMVKVNFVKAKADGGDEQFRVIVIVHQDSIDIVVRSQDIGQLFATPASTFSILYFSFDRTPK
jgi:hypothetical protein